MQKVDNVCDGDALRKTVAKSRSKGSSIYSSGCTELIMSVKVWVVAFAALRKGSGDESRYQGEGLKVKKKMSRYWLWWPSQRR